MEPQASDHPVKVTLFYWPKIERITYIVEEIGGENRKTAMILNFFSPSEKILKEELAIYNSPNVIQIELPSSNQITYDNLLEPDDDYTSYIKRLLGKAYNITIEPSKNPQEIAEAACSYLDGLLDKRHKDACYVNYLRVLTKDIRQPKKQPFRYGKSISPKTVHRMATFEFAKIMIKVTLNEINGLIEPALIAIKPKVFTTIFPTLAGNFLDDLDKLQDKQLTADFEKLDKELKNIQTQLEGNLSFSKWLWLKSWLYEFIRIFSKDPQLESLRNFNKVVNNFEDTFPNISIPKKPEPSKI